MLFKIIRFSIFFTFASTLPIHEQGQSPATSYASTNFESERYVPLENNRLSEHTVHYQGSVPTYVQRYVTPALTKVVPAVKSYDEKEEQAPANYQFHYAIADEHTGDYKSHTEHREGDVVRGEYSLKEPDGTIRTVKYAVDKKSGFNAVIIKSGRAAHPHAQARKVVAPQVHEQNY